MQRKAFLAALAAAVLAAAVPAHADDGIVVIANTPLRNVDGEALRRVYSGRALEIDGQAVRPVNLAPGQTTRRRFLAAVMQQSDDEYVAYWTVRRYVGKGAPPREMTSAAEVLDHVRNTPGAIAYIDASELRPGVNVVWRH